MLPRGVTVGLTVLISLVWAGNVIVGFTNPALRDPMINAIFAIVVGSLYALGRKGDTAGPLERVKDAIEKTLDRGREDDSTQDRRGGDAP